MKKSLSFKKYMKVCSVIILSLGMVMSFSSVSDAKWSYGLGTGFFGLNIDGDIGWTTQTLGAIELDLDLDASDTSDLMETAFGLGGYATDGTWMINYSFGQLELEGTSSGNIPSGPVSSRINWEKTFAELTVGYPVYEDKASKLLIDGGLRYTKHEINTHTQFSGGAINDESDGDWTDVVIGVTFTMPFADVWSWNTRANAGFGGSDGTYLGQTGVTWRFYKGWSTSLYGKYTSIDFEDGSRGSNDWYKYDADEYGAGINLAYNW